MSPSIIIQISISLMGALAGLVLRIVLSISYKIYWTKVVLLCLIWMITFFLIHSFGMFLIGGVVATFLTLVILGKLEPRDRSTQ